MLQSALVLFAFNVIHRSLASYCGQAAIPFTFQVLHSGQPVLGCARPKCFGWNANGTRAGDAAQFYRIDGKEDGYLRRSDQLLRSPFRNPYMTPRVAKCEEKYTDQGCAPGQWLGGIAPRGLNGAKGLQVRCCWYAPLVESEDRGVAMVSNGQLVVGGEVLNADELDGFDYIADIRAETTKQGNTVYAVYIRRMECKDVEEAAPANRLAQPPVRDVVYAAPPLKVSTPYGRQLQQGYGIAAAPAPRYISPPAPPGYNQPLNSMPVAQQSVAQAQQYAPVQNPQTPVMQPYAASPYLQYNQTPAQAQTAQPQLFGLFNPAPNPLALSPQQMNGFMQQPAQSLPQPFQHQPRQVAQPISTTPLPTIPPLTFPTLDQIPKIDIPSVEDVENVIPPVQRAILTTVARFFGVL
ncbi:unnamed protein product [Strongylus vulgaris]|uniref:WxxW domain-containing protein n=1 Tax=Strongylus vulgaris TaxID=40348 RepID=A0A3P7IVT4_STRVU|nr:unnamed protein product [Strongylus vulgaris]